MSNAFWMTACVAAMVCFAIHRTFQEAFLPTLFGAAVALALAGTADILERRKK